jgi:transposase
MLQLYKLMLKDKTVKNLIHKFEERAIKSNKKHGNKIHEVDRPTIEWLTEALEEAMDLCVYLQKILEQLKEEEYGNSKSNNSK